MNIVHKMVTVRRDRLKQEIREEILGAARETFAKLDKHMEAIASDTGDPLARLRRGGRMYVQFGLNHPEHYFLTFTVAGRGPLKSTDVLEAGLHSFDCLRRSVSACVEAGQLRSTDVEELTQSIWAAMHGLIMLLIAKPDFPFVERNRLIDGVLVMCIEGIRKH